MLHAIGHSTAEAPEQAADEVCREFPAEPALILFFSDGERFAAFSQALHRRYPRSAVLGASTFASFSPEGLCCRGLSAAALTGGLAVSAGLIREITRDPGMIYRDAVLEALAGLPAPAGAENTCCFLLNPAGTAGEEAVLDTLGAALEGTGIPVFGGSASSEVCARGAVSLNGGVYENSSVFVFLRLARGHFQITQENIFRPLSRSFTVTKASLARRTLYELDGQPAADVLCGALGVSRGELPEALAAHPFGRLYNGRHLINEVERVNTDGSVTAYCRFYEGSTVFLLTPREFQPTMAETFQNLRAAMPDPEFTVAVNCYSRTQMYLKNGWMEAFTRAMTENLGSYLGLTSHGEQLGGNQLNLTLLLLSVGGTGGEGD